MSEASKGKQSKFELIIGAVDRFSNTFKAFNDRTAASTAQLGRLQKAVEGLGRATGFSRLHGAVSNVGTSLKTVVGEGKNLVSTVAGLAGKFSLLFGAAGGGLFALAKSTANAGDMAAKSAARAGVGVKVWQEYAHAANLSDVNNEQLEKGFVKLQDAALKAFKGDKAQMSLLKMAGIDPKTAKGEVKNADTMFLELADKVKALQDAGQGAKAVNLVKSMLGEEGTKLMPMLLGGAAGLKEMRLEAHKLGIVLSADDAMASEAFNDGITKMLGSLKGIGYSLGRVVLPPLTKLMDKFTGWASGQREVMATGFAEWVDKLDIDAVWKSVESGMASLKRLGAAANGIAQAFGGWENVAIALAAVISGKFLLSIGSLIMSFSKLGLAIMTTPVGWFLAACAGIGAAVYAIYKNWDGFTAYFQGLWQGVREAFSRNWFEGIVRFLIDFNPVRLVSKGINELISYFTGLDFFSIFQQKFAKLGDALPQWTKKLLGMGEAEPAAGTASTGMSGFADMGMADPLGIGASVRGIAESRSEHVEKEEIELIVRAADGTSVTATRSGGGAGSNLSMQTGPQAMAVY